MMDVETFLNKMEKELKVNTGALNKFDTFKEAFFDYLESGGPTDGLIYQNNKWYFPDGSYPAIAADTLRDPQVSAEDFAILLIREV